jgi:Mg2+ and Co2+ transporter CorA
MKRLTGVTVILAGIGAVGGVFGMSEAANAINGHEGSGFYVVVLVTVLAAIVGVWFLRKIDWL